MTVTEESANRATLQTSRLQQPREGAALPRGWQAAQKRLAPHESIATRTR